MIALAHRHLKDHFIPHHGNGHVPHVLKHRVLAGYGLIAIMLKVVAITLPIALPSSWTLSSELTAGNVVSLTNETRANLGLTGLKADGKLAEAARLKAEDMMSKSYFAHTSPEGLTGFALIRQTGYKYRFAGENLAVHYDTAEGVTEGWLASPKHKANIVNPRFSEIGVGIAQGTYKNYPTTMVVQLFAEPAATLAAAQVADVSSPDVRNQFADVGEAVPVGATLQDAYAFAEPAGPMVEVLGLTIRDLDDDVRRFYLYAVLFLLMATAVSVLAKYRHQHLPHVLHAILIASLGIGLMKF